MATIPQQSEGVNLGDRTPLERLHPGVATLRDLDQNVWRQRQLIGELLKLAGRSDRERELLLELAKAGQRSERLAHRLSNEYAREIIAHGSEVRRLHNWAFLAKIFERELTETRRELREARRARREARRKCSTQIH
jgi:hypothetical protein